MDEKNNNSRKTKLIMFTLIAIIAVLLAGVIYQFVVIKKLEKKTEQPTSSICYVLEENKKIYKNFCIELD